jgi:alkylhydroperoxidase/carboxymuconolactone decarboxylase family protein YurZ
LVRELAQVWDDAARVGMLNRLGSRTANENTWNQKRLQRATEALLQLAMVIASRPALRLSATANGRIRGLEEEEAGEVADNQS